MGNTLAVRFSRPPNRKPTARGFTPVPLALPVILIGREFALSAGSLRQTNWLCSKVGPLTVMRMVVAIWDFVQRDRNSIHAVGALRNQELVAALVREVAR